MFRFESTQVRTHLRTARAYKLSEHGEKIFFLIRGVFGRCLMKIAESGFKRAAMFRFKRTFRRLGCDRQQRLEESVNAPMTLREQADRVKKSVLRNADGKGHTILRAGRNDQR